LRGPIDSGVTLEARIDPAGGAAMTLAARPRTKVGWALVPGRKPFRLGYQITDWLAARWRDLAAERDLRARLALDKGERVLAVPPRCHISVMLRSLRER
jgi:hypothetical protein